MSAAARDSVLTGQAVGMVPPSMTCSAPVIITTSLDSAQTDTTAKSSLTSAAIALSAAPTHDPAALTDGELVLLKEWLTKLSDA